MLNETWRSFSMAMETHSFHASSQQQDGVKGEMRALRQAATGKSLFYVIAIQEYLKPSNEALTESGKGRTKNGIENEQFSTENTSHI